MSIDRHTLVSIFPPSLFEGAQSYYLQSTRRCTLQGAQSHSKIGASL